MRGFVAGDKGGGHHCSVLETSLQVLISYKLNIFLRHYLMGVIAMGAKEMLRTQPRFLSPS